MSQISDDTAPPDSVVAQDDTNEPVRAPLWVMVVTGLLAIFGFGVSIYLTIAHFVGTQILACSDSGFINCAKVTTSPQSEILGIPVAVLGLCYFVVALGLFSPWAWRATDRRVHLARLVLVISAMCFVLWLITAEVLIIGSLCLWCTSVHVTTFVMFVATVAATPPLLANRQR